jgi:hypothetical protein
MRRSTLRSIAARSVKLSSRAAVARCAYGARVADVETLLEAPESERRVH